MQKGILFLFASLAFFIAAAQTSSYVDSLRRIQVHGKTDSIKARASFLIGDHYDTDFEKAKPELDKGLAWSKDNTFLTGLYHFYYGGLYYYQEPEKAIAQYEKAIALLKGFKSAESLEFQARAWHNIGAQYQFLGDPKRFMDILTTYCIPLAEQAENDGLTAKYHFAMAMLLMNIKDYPLADEYYKKSLGYHQNTANTNEPDHLEVLVNTVRNLLYWGKTDSSKHYLDIAILLADRHKDSDLYLTTKEVEAMYYIELNAFAKAELTVREALKSIGRFQGSYYHHSLNFQLFKSLSKQGKYREAKATLEDLLGQKNLTPTNRLLYFSNMAKLHEGMKDYPAAYSWLDKAYLLRDSMYKDGYRNEMNAMEKKYQTAEKEQQIARLQAEKKETQLTQKNQRLLNWLLGAGAAAFLLALVVVYNIYKNSKHNTAHKLKELQQQKELEVTQALLDGEERERQRIARDLHDGLGGALSGIKIKLSGEQKNIGAPVIDETILQLQRSIGELRRIARNMMPETLIRSGLEVALRDLCASLSSGKMVIEFQPANIQKTMPVHTQVNIYRIVQELLANAIRHGQAKEIIVQCIHEGNNFLITVEDNGKGFDLKNQTTPKGIGLGNIRNRVDLMRGNIQMESAPGEGTTVNIELYV